MERVEKYDAYLYSLAITTYPYYYVKLIPLEMVEIYYDKVNYSIINVTYLIVVVYLPTCCI